MPRSRSMSIQSDTVPRRPSLPCTAPARATTRACRARASVSVDLPASGWLITANDRRREASGRGLGGCGPRRARRAHRVGPSCSLTGATSLRSGIGATAGGHSDGTSAAARRQESAADGAAGQGWSASNSASATTSSSASRRMWPSTACRTRRIAGGAVAPGGQVAELPPPQGLGDPAGVEVLQAVGQGHAQLGEVAGQGAAGDLDAEERVDDEGVVVQALEHVGQALAQRGRRRRPDRGRPRSARPGRRR